MTGTPADGSISVLILRALLAGAAASGIDHEKLGEKPGALELTIAGCRVQRQRERKLPALTDLLLEFMQRAPGKTEVCWLCRDAFRDVLGEVSSEAGWRLVLGRPRNQCVEPIGECS